ncbi:MAG: methylmalonyl-CoA mutase family protein [Thaumarchaeota archaeon]|nr:methylmalonyl-CoA mutase family protein [Nitrososphaerota archaeon]
MIQVARKNKQSFWSLKIKEIENKRRERPSTPEKKELNKLLASWRRRVSSTKQFESSSGIPIRDIYTPQDLRGLSYTSDLGLPGEYPFTRGIYHTMYRGKLWTMRMFSGFGTPEDTNRRLKHLLENGETGLSLAFDMPTLYGYDADHKRARGEVGRCGVNVSSVADMETIFEGIPLDQVSTSMTINAPAPILTCMYAATAEKAGIPLGKLRGTTQTDILKEYIAQKEWVFPPEAHLRLIRDMIAYCTQHMPHWHCISISGYHIREAGANAVQELAFTLADGFAYVELGLEAGLKVDDFADRLSFFFNCDIDFFEEIAKFRAARKIWATVMKEKYGAKKPGSMLLRFHTQSSGASLTWQQPLNNIVRTTIEALAAVLAGTQSLHTNAYDEAWALPTEETATIALRTQQIIAEETGIPKVADSLGGSYYVEWLTKEMEKRAYRYFEKIESIGGIIEAIKAGYIQREIAETAYKRQQQIEKGETVIVGVNKFMMNQKSPIKTLEINDVAQRKQIERLRILKGRRESRDLQNALLRLKKTFMDTSANSMPAILTAVKAQATLGEIMDVGREVFGEWKGPGEF